MRKTSSRAKAAAGELPIRLFRTPAAWRAWLEKHHASADGIWLQFAKKSSGIRSITYAQALDEALCCGWIDEQAKSLDEKHYLQRFTPRRSKSIWSKINVAKVAALMEAGRMHPAGLAAVDAAKADGRWDAAYDSHRTMTVPADFQAALDNHPQAKAFFHTLNRANTYAIVWRLQTARNAKLRPGKIVRFIEMLAAGQTFHRSSSKGEACPTRSGTSPCTREEAG